MPAVNLFRRVLHNSATLLAGQSAASVLTFFQSLVVVRALGPERFGLYALVLAFTQSVTQFLSSRTWETLIKYVPEYRERRRERRAAHTLQLCLLIEVASALVASALVIVSAPLVSRLLLDDAPDGPANLRFFALLPLLTLADEVMTALLRLGKQFRSISIHQSGVACAKLAFVLALLPTGLTIPKVVAVHLTTAALGSLFLLYCGRIAAVDLGLRGFGPAGWRRLRRQLRVVFRFTLFTNLSATSRLVTSRADVLLLGFFASTEVAGIYSVARRLTDQVVALSDPLYQAVFPETSVLVARKEWESLRTLQRRMTTSIAAVVVPFCLLSDIVAVWAVPFAYGEEYVGAVVLLQVLVWRLVWVPLCWMPGYFLSLGRARLVAGLNWFDALVYVLLLLALVPSLGSLGAAIATTARCVLWIAVVAKLYRGTRMSPIRSA